MFEVEFLKYATMEYRFVALKTEQYVWKEKKGTRERKGGGKDTLKINYCVMSYFLKLLGNALFDSRGT